MQTSEHTLAQERTMAKNPLVTSSLTMRYVLESSILVYAPGFVRRLRVMHNTGKRKDKAQAVKLLKECWSLPAGAALYVLTCPDNALVQEGDGVTFIFGSAR